MRMMRTMSVIGVAPGGDDPIGADPEVMMRHRRIQVQRPTGNALAALLAQVAVEPVPHKPKRPQVDWEGFVRSAMTIT